MVYAVAMIIYVLKFSCDKIIVLYRSKNYKLNF